MPPDLELSEEDLAALDPAARTVVKLLLRHAEHQEAQLRERDEKIGLLVERIEHLTARLFGPSSERMPPIRNDVRAVSGEDERTLEGKPMPEEPKAREHERRRKGRKLSEPRRKATKKRQRSLPTIIQNIKVQPHQLPAGYSLDDFRVVGEGVVVHRIEHVREHLVVQRFILESLASVDGEHIVQAVAPVGVIEGGLYGPGVYSHVIVSKCADSMPLYRLEQKFARAGLDFPRSTQCTLFHRAAELLTPLYDRILEVVREAPYVHADETTLPVVEPKRCKKGWIWAALSERAVAYAYDESRSGQVAVRILGGTKGSLLIDGYSGYNAVTGDDGRARSACWSHARRKFWEARTAGPEVVEVLELIAKLYAVEHVAAEQGVLGTEAHRLLRAQRSHDIVDAIDAWVDAREGKFGPKTKVGKALTYAKNHRKALRRFLADPKLPLDNNIAERALRIFALGRKNFLFAGHDDAAQNIAVLQSIVSTCALHGVNPYDYIRDVLIRIQTHPAAELDAIMPWRWGETVSPSDKQIDSG